MIANMCSLIPSFVTGGGADGAITFRVYKVIGCCLSLGPLWGTWSQKVRPKLRQGWHTHKSDDSLSFGGVHPEGRVQFDGSIGSI
jgi:hypothetical protein